MSELLLTWITQHELNLIGCFLRLLFKRMLQHCFAVHLTFHQRFLNLGWFFSFKMLQPVCNILRAFRSVGSWCLAMFWWRLTQIYGSPEGQRRTFILHFPNQISMKENWERVDNLFEFLFIFFHVWNTGDFFIFQETKTFHVFQQFWQERKKYLWRQFFLPG